MKLDEKEVERLAEIGRSAFHNHAPALTWDATSSVFQEACMREVRAILAALPDAPSWATPEAKAFLEAAARYYGTASIPDDGRRMPLHELWGAMEAEAKTWLASLRPKFVERRKGERRQQ
ncbi:MAG: hypothetical protein KGL39_03850 [Patescibacteria group bacterium]|nr:hypothetical protein [Patescibacteria group bacterium]